MTADRGEAPKRDSSDSALTIVIPTIGRSAKLGRVVDRLADQQGVDFEVIVVLDAADDATEDADLVRAGLDLRVERATRPGASAARNRGIAEANGSVILFLDDDVMPEPGMVTAHAEWHARHPEAEIGVLGHVRWADELKVTPFMRWVERGVQFDYHSIEGTEAGWGRFYTANVSVKKELLERVGGFDEERLPFGYEDLDLALRMHQEGFRLLYNRQAGAEHLHEMDLDFWRRRVRRTAVAERQFCRLHPEIEPFFFQVFSGAAAAPRASGRGISLIRVIGPRFPLLGRRAWTSADMYFKQALAPYFLEAWEDAADVTEGSAQPDLSERWGSPSGSMPSGPK